MKNKSTVLLLSLLASSLLSSPPGVVAQGTAFTYQGRLAEDGDPADGLFDLTFGVWNSAVGPAQVGSTITNTAVEVSEGLFTVTLDFGSGVFTGPDRWLEIGVRTNGGGGFTTLGPRTRITAAPYASYAGTAATVPNDSIGSSQLIDDLDLGTGSIVGRLDVFRTTAGTAAISLVGSGSQISTYGSDGLEQIRLWGGGYGEILLNNSLVNNANAVTLSANGGSGGYLALNNSDGSTRANLSGADSGGSLTLSASDGSVGAVIDGDSSGAGVILLNNAAGATRVALDGEGFGSGGEIIVDESDGSDAVEIQASSGGHLYLNDSSGQTAVRISGSASTGGYQHLYQADGQTGVFLDGDSAGGGLVYVYAAGGTVGVALDGESGGAGNIGVRDSSGLNRVVLDGESAGTGGEISVYDDSGTETIEILGAEDAATGGQIMMRNASGINTIQLDSDASGVGCGYIRLYKSDGTATVTIEADTGGDGRVTTQELAVTGGSDLSEQFDIQSADETVLPGSVVCIDPLNPGKLVVSARPYDRTVAGIVSGAGGVKPGVLMGQAGTVADGEHPVALTGRVYCLVDAEQGSIQPGDLITTSAIPGHGMKATDHTLAQGAILGKAMTGLEQGQGLVLVLVALQ